MRLTVRAPATAANLGPGFDTLGLALDLVNEFALEADAEPGIEVDGEGADELGDPAANLVVRTITRAFGDAGAPPPYRLTCRIRIPLRRGLGSSATAVAAGVLLAARLRGAVPDPAHVLDEAVAIEGHADNVAACLLGGLTIAYQTDDGWRAERLEPSVDLHPVVFVPEREAVATDMARRALPELVPLADASFNLGRAALAVAALTERPELLADALADRLHQPHRLALAPGAASLFHQLQIQGLPVCVSGS